MNEEETAELLDDEVKVKGLVDHPGWEVLIRWVTDAQKTERAALLDDLERVVMSNAPRVVGQIASEGNHPGAETKFNGELVDLNARVVDRRAYIKYLGTVERMPDFVLGVAKQTRFFLEQEKEPEDETETP